MRKWLPWLSRWYLEIFMVVWIVAAIINWFYLVPLMGWLK